MAMAGASEALSALSVLSFDALKAKQRRLRDGFDERLGLRVHRAISWLRGAEQAMAACRLTR